MRRPKIRLATLFALSLMAFLPAWQTAAQDDIEVEFPIDVFACDTAPAIGDYDQTGLSGPPADCVPAAGVVATATNTGDTELGSCTTGADGRCTVPILFDEAVPDVTVTVDESTMPDGYSRMQVNPITVPVNLEHGVLFAGILTESEPDPPEGDSSLTVTALNCPPSGPDEEIDDSTCVEPAVGIEFAIGTPNTGNVNFVVTDESGVLTTSLEPYALAPDANPVNVGEILSSNPYGEITGYDVSCENTVSGENVPLTFETGNVAPGGTTYGVVFNVTPGDQIACTWLNMYQSPPDTTEPTTVPADTPVPNTPAPPIEPEPDALQVQIRGGSCNQPGELVAELAGASAPDGETAGNASAIPVQTSVSSVQASFDALLADDHLIGVYAPDGDEDMLACGEIGGVPDDNGDLSLGLREVDGSGFSGVAFLTAGDTNAGQIGISVFIAEGLSPDADT